LYGIFLHPDAALGTDELWINVPRSKTLPTTRLGARQALAANVIDLCHNLTKSTGMKDYAKIGRAQLLLRRPALRQHHSTEVPLTPSVTEMLSHYGEAVEFRDSIQRNENAACASLLDEYEQLCRDLEEEMAGKLVPSNRSQVGTPMASRWKRFWRRVV
jgi:hypothetical protein